MAFVYGDPIGIGIRLAFRIGLLCAFQRLGALIVIPPLFPPWKPWAFKWHNTCNVFGLFSFFFFFFSVFVVVVRLCMGSCPEN